MTHSNKGRVMRIRKMVIGVAALLTAASFATGMAAGASGVGARSHARLVHHTPRLAKAHWLRQVKPHATHAAINSSAALGGGTHFASSDGGLLNGNLPKDSLPAGNLGNSPTVSASHLSGHGNDLSTALGPNAYDQEVAHPLAPFDVEPPDQGLCAGNGYVIEPVNLVLRIYHQRGLTPASPPMALESFFGNPYAFGFQGGDVTVQGDVKCLWDSTSRRWFVTQLLVDFTAGTSHFQVAVSTSSNPLGSYNVYSVNNTDLGNPGCPCFGDQPLLGANRDALFISTNEFPIFTGGFNGSVLYALDKNALVAGSPTPNVWSDPVGLNLPTPDAGGIWYSIQPATSPNPRSGTEYGLSALEFFGTGDTRIATWALTNTDSISSATPNLTAQYSIVNSEFYIGAPFARQQAGPIPLGDCVTATGCGLFAGPTPVSEGPIQTNDDRMNQVVFAQGDLWSGVNTAVVVGGHLQAGIAWFAVAPSIKKGVLHGTMDNQGYIAPPGADVLFPSIGVGDNGKGVIAFTLTGPNNYPSAAFAKISARDGAGPVQVAIAGASPQDGFTEYNGGPRWGDYSAAVADGNNIFFATEMIQYANCSDTAFLADPTCGGTRGAYANWGTSLSVLKP